MSRHAIAVAVLIISCVSIFRFGAEAAPELESAAIMVVSGSDANGNGYYETYSFEFELWAVGEEEQTYDVAARVHCTTTGQGWYTEAWPVAGPGPEKIFVTFDQSDFELTGVHSLDFRVELWTADFSAQHAAETTIAGEPVNVEVPGSGVPPPPPPTLAAATETSMVLSLAGNGGPPDTLYCVQVVSDPIDPKRNGNYVWPLEGIGQRFDVPVWRPIDAWQNLVVTSPSLNQNTTYTFMAQAKLDGVQSAYSAGASLCTLAAAPGQCVVVSASAVSIFLAVDPAVNPDRTLFAIKFTGTVPADSAYDQSWIGACSSVSPGPVWLTASEWSSTAAAALRPLTTYTFAAWARNADGIESAPGPPAGKRTSVAGDVNGDCRVNILDMLTIRRYLYTQVCPGPQAASADLNGDDTVNILDMIVCRANLMESCSGE